MKHLAHWRLIVIYHEFQTRQFQVDLSYVGQRAKRFTASACIFKSCSASRAAQKTHWNTKKMGLNKANDIGLVFKAWASLSEFMLVLVVQSNTQVMVITNLPHQESVFWVSAEDTTDTREGERQRQEGQVKHETWKWEVGGGGERKGEKWIKRNRSKNPSTRWFQNRGKTINTFISSP